MSKSNLVEKRNRLITEAQALVNGKQLNPEIRTKFNAMMAEVDTLDADIQIEERVAGFQSEQRSAGRPPREGIEGGNGTSPEREKRAFREWMRTGVISEENRSVLRESRALGATVGTGVGATTITNSILIPSGFDPELHTAQKSYGQLVGAVRRLNTATGEPLKVATLDDTANSLSVIGESVAVSETDQNLGGFVSYVDELTTGLVTVANSLIEDSAFDVSAFIQDTFAARYYKGLASMIQQGNGSHIASIASSVAVGATSAAPTAIVLNDLIATYGALDPAYVDRASWVMAPDTRRTLMQITDSYGRPLLQPDPSGKPFNALYGQPIVLSTFAPTIAASATPILFGDLTASYTLRTVGDLQIVRLTERYAELNQTGFIGRTRAGGYLTTVAASPSLTSLKMHS
jgi:HK97 family phage major capsid protein